MLFIATTDIIGIFITIIGIGAFATVISVLYKHYIDTSISEIKKGNKDIELIDLMIYENNKNVQKRKKATEITKNILYYGVLAFLIPIFGLSIYSKIKNNVTTIGGNSVLVVASGSMSEKNQANEYLFTYDLNNQFQTYDLVVVEKVKNESSLNKYDVIAFRNYKGVNIIHRIRDIVTQDGVTHYVTRGDAVDGDDGFYPKFDDVIGVYRGKRIKGVGVLIMFFQSYIGIITSISVVYTMIYISAFNRKLENALYDREEMLEAHFDIDSMDENSYLELEQTTNQKIYYHGEAYVFSSDGFIEKHLMNDEEKKDFEKLQEITNSQNDKKKKNNKTKVKEDLTDGKK